MGFSSCQHFLQMSIFLLRFQSFRSCFRDKSFFCWSFHCSSNYLMFSRSDTWHTCDESQRCLYWTTVKIDEGFEEKGTTMRKWEKTGKWPVEQFCGIFIDENWEGDERRSTLIRNSLILSDANQTLSSDSLSLFLSLAFVFSVQFAFIWMRRDGRVNKRHWYICRCRRRSHLMNKREKRLWWWGSPESRNSVSSSRSASSATCFSTKSFSSFDKNSSTHGTWIQFQLEFVIEQIQFSTCS